MCNRVLRKMEDRRAVKTKTAIINAFAELMAEKDINEISVKEIAEKADINRITFYNHYLDIYDLYEKIQTQTLSDYDKIISTSPTHNYDEVFEKIIEYTIENKNVCKLLISSENSNFQNKVYELFIKKYKEISMYEDNLMEIKESWNYITVYNIYGTIAIISEWIKNDMKYPPEKIRKILSAIDNSIDNVFYVAED